MKVQLLTIFSNHVIPKITNYHKRNKNFKNLHFENEFFSFFLRRLQNDQLFF